VDDSAVVRSIIADTPGMKVVGKAGDGRQALDVLDSARPDVITLDIQMPNMGGLAMPAVTAGVHFKVNDGIADIDRRLTGTLSGIGYDCDRSGSWETAHSSRTLPSL